MKEKNILNKKNVIDKLFLKYLHATKIINIEEMVLNSIKLKSEFKR